MVISRSIMDRGAPREHPFMTRICGRAVWVVTCQQGLASDIISHSVLHTGDLLWQVAGLHVAATQGGWFLWLDGFACLGTVEFGVAVSANHLACPDA